MTDVNTSSPGQNLLVGDRYELFKFEYATDVLTAFETANVTLNRFMKRMVRGSKGVKFPVSGNSKASFKKPGQMLVGGDGIPVTDKTVNIDGMLVSSDFVDQLEELMTYWDYRGEQAKKQGVALAKQMDETLLRLSVLAARQPSNIPGHTASGSVITDANMKTDPMALAKALYAAAARFDENGVEDTDRVAYLSPTLYYSLIQAKETINKLYGGEGNYADGTIARIAGIELVKTTHLPKVNLSTDAAITAAGMNPADVLAHYRGDFSKTAAVVTHRGAIGIALAMDVTSAVTWQELYLAYLLRSSLAYGADVLRPECAIELAVA